MPNTWCAVTPKVIGHFGGQRPRNLFSCWLPSPLSFHVHSTAVLEPIQPRPASSPREPHGSVGFIRVNRPTVARAYHHSLTVRESSPRWLLLSLPPKCPTVFHDAQRDQPQVSPFALVSLTRARDLHHSTT